MSSNNNSKNIHMQRAKDTTQPSATVSSNNNGKCKKDLIVLEVRLPNNSQKTIQLPLLFIMIFGSLF